MDATLAMANWGCLKGATATPVDSFSGSVTRFVSPHGQFYLKRKPSMARVAREVRVLNILRRQHLPVTLPLLTHAQLPYVADEHGVYCLYAALPGSPYDNFAGRQGLRNARSCTRTLRLIP